MSVSTQEEMAQYRRDNFGVRVEPARHPDFENEKTFFFTQNGRQEQPISLAPHEARKLFDLLRAEFNF